MCTFVGRGILAAWANNAQCIGMDTGDERTAQYPSTYLGVYDGRGLLYLGNQARNLKSDNLSF